MSPPIGGEPMRGRRGELAVALVAAAWLGSARDAGAFCRTTTCPLPADWNPTSGCLPPSPFTDANGRSWPDFASYCAASFMPPAKVLPIWWGNACVSYDIHKSASSQIPYADAARIIDSAFAKWTGTACPIDSTNAGPVSIKASNLGAVDCDLVQYNSDQGNQHVIVFRNPWNHNDANNTLGLTTVTFDADTGEIYDADMEINDSVHLSAGDVVAPGADDFESIVTHEAGHFFGLAHSGDPSATMFAHYTPGSTTMRRLTPDDVAGLCSIYPPDGTRSVDPTVASSGAVGAAKCDATPRHGFQSQCAQPLKHGCAVASSEPHGDSGAGAIVATLAWLGVAGARRRARTTGSRSPSDRCSGRHRQ
jgi:matrixin